MNLKNNYKISIPVAILITLIAIIYQRSTGPTYPKKFWLDTGAGDVKIKLPRSHGGDENCPVVLPLIDKDSNATLSYKRYPTNDEWVTIPMIKKAGTLFAELPHQPPAGKLIYFINLTTMYGTRTLGSKDEPIYIRFKADVPTYILAPHIFFMFISMLLAIVAAVEAFYKTNVFRKICFITTGSLLTGGMVLGPIVQKYAFGVYWAGFPYDWDLTDNKLLISVIFCSLAAITNLKKPRPFFVILAAFVLIGMYSIPHSMQGSQYNYETKGMDYQ
jgi:hypothetical protein